MTQYIKNKEALYIIEDGFTACLGEKVGSINSSKKYKREDLLEFLDEREPLSKDDFWQRFDNIVSDINSHRNHH